MRIVVLVALVTAPLVECYVLLRMMLKRGFHA